MSIDHLLDGTCRFWTHTEGSGSFDPDTLTPGDVEACYLAPAQMDRVDMGAGQRNVGKRWLFLTLESVAEVENVVEMLTGPEQGTLWRISEPPQHPRSDHTEAYVEPWTGALPEEGS